MVSVTASGLHRGGEPREICLLATGYHRNDGRYCFIIHLRPEFGGSRLFRNVGRYLLESTETQQPNPLSTDLPQWKFKTSGAHSSAAHDRTGPDRTDVSQAVQTEVPFLALHVAPFLADISTKVVKILKKKNSKSKIEVHGWNKNIL